MNKNFDYNVFVTNKDKYKTICDRYNHFKNRMDLASTLYNKWKEKKELELSSKLKNIVKITGSSQLSILLTIKDYQIEISKDIKLNFIIDDNLDIDDVRETLVNINLYRNELFELIGLNRKKSNFVLSTYNYYNVFYNTEYQNKEKFLKQELTNTIRRYLLEGNSIEFLPEWRVKDKSIFEHKIQSTHPEYHNIYILKLKDSYLYCEEAAEKNVRFNNGGVFGRLNIYSIVNFFYNNPEYTNNIIRTNLLNEFLT